MCMVIIFLIWVNVVNIYIHLLIKLIKRNYVCFNVSDILMIFELNFGLFIKCKSVFDYMYKEDIKFVVIGLFECMIFCLVL